MVKTQRQGGSCRPSPALLAIALLCGALAPAVASAAEANRFTGDLAPNMRETAQGQAALAANQLHASFAVGALHAARMRGGAIVLGGNVLQNARGLVAQNFMTAPNVNANAGNAVALRAGAVQLTGAMPGR